MTACGQDGAESRTLTGVAGRERRAHSRRPHRCRRGGDFRCGVVGAARRRRL